jgi:hypothetical protein
MLLLHNKVATVVLIFTDCWERPIASQRTNLEQHNEQFVVNMLMRGDQTNSALIQHHCNKSKVSKSASCQVKVAVYDVTRRAFG